MNGEYTILSQKFTCIREPVNPYHTFLTPPADKSTCNPCVVSAHWKISELCVWGVNIDLRDIMVDAQNTIWQPCTHYDCSDFTWSHVSQ
jgi:hypothetical protein